MKNKQFSVIDLLQGYIHSDLPDIAVLGITSDSRQVKPGYVFFALLTDTADGRTYCDEAIKAGACAIVYDNKDGYCFNSDRVKVFALPDCVDKIGAIAARYYQYPSQSMKIVAVTGTNGKTSVCFYAAQLLNALHVTTGVIGTMGYGVYPDLKHTGYTTPDAITTQACLAALRDSGCKVVLMEVSSHALVLGRVSEVCFDTAVLTQIAADHLDFHGSMEAYTAAKAALFQWPGLKSVVINVDDAAGCCFLRDIVGQSSTVARIGYGMKELTTSYNTEHMLQLLDYQFDASGSQMKVAYAGEVWLYQLSLLGLFNIYNMLATLGIMHSLGYTAQQFEPHIPHVSAVFGRMQSFFLPDGVRVVIDFAHTADALQKVLEALQALPHRRMVCVFGCGGNRDTSKRPGMAKVAARYADKIVITEDNSRGEPLQDIIRDIISGFSSEVDYQCILKRSDAIDYACNTAKPNDIILIAGKGHEAYIDYGDSIVLYNDVEYVTALVQRRVIDSVGH